MSVAATPKHIAVLGAGLTGLSSAFYLSRKFPAAKITVFDRRTRAGGWVDSTHVDNAEGGRVVVEAGPRTLRPNSNAVKELINLLDLTSQVITTPKTSPAARNRFLCLPDAEPQLQAIPTSILDVLRAPPPLRRILLSGILSEPFKSRNRLPGASDESLDSLLSRRFGAEFARTFGSAMVHGIYAADSRKLSVRSAFPSVWNAEERGWGSIVLGILRMELFSTPVATSGDYELGDVPQLMKNTSVFSFRDGMSTLTDALRSAVLARGVEILLDESVNGINATSSSLEITTNARTISPTHLISTLDLPQLSKLLSPSSFSLPHLTANNYSDVTTINFVFPSLALDASSGNPSSHPIHPAGFGYLIPRPSTDYSPSNPGMLGVVFDSCALSAQDTGSDGTTKITVMMGGPHPITPSHFEPRVVLSHVANQLGLESRGLVLPQPLHTRISHHKECIPTLGVGHLERMRELRAVLKAKDGCNGRMEVIGAGVDGVSVGDCVEAGRRAGSCW